MNNSRAPLCRLENLYAELVADPHSTACLELSARVHHRFVLVRPKRFEKQKLGRCPRIPCAEESCAENFRGVDDNCVA
jgi:hypothetical protein